MRVRAWLPTIVTTSVLLVLIAAKPLIAALIPAKQQSGSVLATLEHLLRRDSSWIAFIAMILGFCLAVDLGWRSKRARFAIPLFLGVWWCAAETFAAPHLAVPFRLLQLIAIQDPDHWPRSVGPGWNSDHLRATPEPKEFRKEDFNLLFLGDSFTYGSLVSGEQAFPALVGQQLAARRPDMKLRVANFGWTSSSPQLSRRRLEDMGERYAPDLVVMCVDMTDFGDDLRYHFLLEQQGLYRYFDNWPMSLRLFQLAAPDAYQRALMRSVGGAPTKRYFANEQPLDASRPWLETLKANLDRMDAWCKARGIVFAVVVIPRHFQFDAAECPRNWEAGEYALLGPYSLEPFRWFDEIRGRVGYPIFSLLDDFRNKTESPVCFEHDPHWTPVGHTVAARAITRDLEPIVAKALGEVR